MRPDTVLEGPGVGFWCILMKEGPNRRNKSTSSGWVILPFCTCPPSALSFGLCASWNFSFHCPPDLSFWKAQVFQNNIFIIDRSDRVCDVLATLVQLPFLWLGRFFFLQFSKSAAMICSLTFFLIFNGDKIQWFSFMEACWHY